ncbi:MAG TPA: amidohydrolase family protein [Dissulfurispiraceae bacterium]|nr:amidohydrolase family protein [Dissulfurispiraceae bacterium]
MSKFTHIFCGCLIDGSGGPVQERVLLRIDKGIIAALDKDLNAERFPPETIDWSECTLIPGLVDCHVHLFMSGSSDSALRLRQLNYSFIEAEPIISRHLSAQARYGIVALRDGGDYGGHALRFKRESLPGMSGAPAFISCAGRAWRSKGRYGRLIGRAPENGQSLAGAIQSDTDRPDHIKIVNSGINSLAEFGKETRPQFSLQELAEAVAAAENMGLKIMVHANGKIPVGFAAQAGCHSIEHGYFIGEDNLRLLAERRVCWIPTAYPMKAYSRLARKGSKEANISVKTLDHQLEQMRLAKSIGVPMAIGTDCGSLGVEHGESFSEEMRLFSAAGFTLSEVVRLATASGARLLGIGHKMGELKVGMPATFVVLKGGPATLYESLKSPDKVYINGRQLD